MKTGTVPFILQILTVINATHHFHPVNQNENSMRNSLPVGTVPSVINYNLLFYQEFDLKHSQHRGLSP